MKTRLLIGLIVTIGANPARADEAFLPQPKFAMGSAARSDAAAMLAAPISMASLLELASDGSRTTTNKAELQQIGLNNFGSLAQTGGNNLAAVRQQGGGNLAVITQANRGR
ncbi:curlin repeat-containing protein [Beijerinckia sp. L45]|uniref:curlin repeat-containing protein n=1 Tax=Beijerinckia sp. L45 TaxID=1641855 RepID=UPI00131C416D|nr:curlin repeat-containing protein [Beijerinckia sp. L45]